MTENIIQNQIRLLAFKAVHVEFSCKDKPSQEESEPKFELKLGDLIFQDNPNLFAKVFSITLVAPSGLQKEVVRYIVEYHTVFECSNSVDENFLKSEFAKISAPAIGFPYVRAFMSTLSLQAGLPPIILPSINFVQFSKERDTK